MEESTLGLGHLVELLETMRKEVVFVYLKIVCEDDHQSVVDKFVCISVIGAIVLLSQNILFCFQN